MIPPNIFTDTRAVTAMLLIMIKHTIFFTGAADHIGISNLTWKHLKSVKQSVVSDHLLECNCLIDFEHFDILAKQTDTSKQIQTSY